MITAVIIEDEKYAAEFLVTLLADVAKDVTVVGIIENIADAVQQLPILNPDLILADIHLEDGLSFSIFEKIQWQKPVIFITAYDAYAIRAFKANGIDYLLKPCDEDELQQALQKFRSAAQVNYSYQLKEVIQQLTTKTNTYKERFAITLGSRIVSIPVQQIAYFYFSNRTTYLVTLDGKKYPYQESLDSLYLLLSPSSFFRVNRNYIINHAGIEKIESHAGRNITVLLQPAPAEGIIAVSKDRITEFKLWLDS
ncbi:MAG TPA: DNA-binding response regulator [Chitinophagaceae bacterium]|jgi:DNA-binding LytR/AlgR family response regulator|nr:DNA-binding response regulator [Chitinophagaceae bacterium]HAN38023.1 DNA-binding response regulator [Chitinophagaceae bacterium]